MRLDPGQIGEPLEVRPGDVELGRLLLHRARAARAASRAIFSASGGSLRAAQPLAQLLDLVVVAALAELLFDGLHLLAQDVLALRLAHLLLHHGGDLLLDAEHLELAADHGEHQAHARLHVERLEDLLLVGDRGLLLREVRGDEVGERAGLAHVVEDAGRLLGQVRHQGRAPRASTRAGSCRARRARRRGSSASLMRVDARAHVRLEPAGRRDAEAAEAVEHDAVVARAEADDLHDAGERADRRRDP